MRSTARVRRRRSVFNPAYTFETFAPPSLTGKPTQIAIDTTSGYLMDSANYRDLVILNGGIRYDDYGIKDEWFGQHQDRRGVGGTWG